MVYNTTFAFSACKKSLPHWIAVKRIYHNLKDSVYYDLLYTPFSIALNALCDSNWAESPDNYRSTNGYWMFIHQNLVLHSAKKEVVVSKSSTKAEYHSIALATSKLYKI
jgi:hypothetical protein